jgi:hypothetical protein
LSGGSFSETGCVAVATTLDTIMRLKSFSWYTITVDRTERSSVFGMVERTMEKVSVMERSFFVDEHQIERIFTGFQL